MCACDDSPASVVDREDWPFDDPDDDAPEPADMIDLPPLDPVVHALIKKRHPAMFRRYRQSVQRATELRVEREAREARLVTRGRPLPALAALLDGHRAPGATTVLATYHRDTAPEYGELFELAAAILRSGHTPRITFALEETTGGAAWLVVAAEPVDAPDEGALARYREASEAADDDTTDAR